ncbi:MAG: ABC transporter substrate-binding protein, partial [Candidatus Acidiferrales bacterium]
MYAGCVPAVRAINAAGGVMGHQLSCQEFDTRGDPADAIPATRQMIASTPNLLFVLGCTSDEASSVVPILEGLLPNSRQQATIGVPSFLAYVSAGGAALDGVQSGRAEALPQ